MAAILLDPRALDRDILKNALTEEQQMQGWQMIHTLSEEFQPPVNEAPPAEVHPAGWPLLLRPIPVAQWSVEEEVQAFKNERRVGWLTCPLDWWKRNEARYNIWAQLSLYFNTDALLDTHGYHELLGLCSQFRQHLRPVNGCFPQQEMF